MVKKYKNAAILILITIITIVVCVYALKWHDVYKENALNTSIITGYIQEVKSSEFHNYISDNPYSVIYFCVSRDENCRAFENEFKDYILNNNLKETIVYLNVNDLSGDNFSNTFDNLYNNDTLRNKNKKLKEVPTVAVYNHVDIIDFVSSKDLTIEDVNSLLKKHGLSGE